MIPVKIGEKVRLNRFLASCGLGTRRECESLIAAGAISVNGAVVKDLGRKIAAGEDTVEYKGKPVSSNATHIYRAYHIAESGNAANLNETFNGKTLRPLDRLDENVRGLLIFTTDSDLIHRCTFTRYPLKSVYRLRTDTMLSNEHLQNLISGVESKGQVLHAVEIERHKELDGECLIVTVYERKTNQIQRLFESLGYVCTFIERIQFGPIRLDGIPENSYRTLSSLEVAALSSAGYSR